MMDSMYEYINDSDLKYIAMAVQCALDGCLVDYPVRYTGDQLFHKFMEDVNIRITETEKERITEQSDIRREM